MSVQFANIFSHSVSCLFMLLLVSLAVQPFSLMSSVSEITMMMATQMGYRVTEWGKSLYVVSQVPQGKDSGGRVSQRGYMGVGPAWSPRPHI